VEFSRFFSIIDFFRSVLFIPLKCICSKNLVFCTMYLSNTTSHEILLSSGVQVPTYPRVVQQSHIYIQIYISAHRSINIYISTHRIYIYIYIYIYTYIYIHIYMYIYILMYVYIYIYINVCISKYICMCICNYMCICISVYIYIWTYICIYTCIRCLYIRTQIHAYKYVNISI